MDSGFAGRRKQIEAALLDFQRAPGKYPLLLRRPEILFSSVREVLLLASGRLPEGEAPTGLAVQRAAGFFVRTALLYPAADHYALLGLGRGADTPAIKERYRQLMRLMHPDFASSAAAGGYWPADAASRVNRAYEVLSSDSQRRSYEEKLDSAGAPAQHRGSPKQPLAQIRAAASLSRPDPRRLLKRMAGAFGVLALLALGASLLARGPDGESLVQRDTPRPAPPAVVLAQSDSPTSPALAQPAPAVVTRAAPLAMLAPADIRPAAAPVQVSSLFDAAPRGAAPIASAVELSPVLPPQSGRILAISAETPTPADPPIAAPSVRVAQAPALPAPASPPALPQRRPSPVAAPAVSMAEAHAPMSALLQQMESGSGERMLSGLERNVRNTSSAQALARQYDGLVEGSRSVKISNVLLKADAREDRLLVRGQVLLDVGDGSSTHARSLPLEAEFAKRNGAVVITRLAPAQPAGPAAQ